MLSARTNSSLYPRICEVKYDDDDFVNEFGKKHFLVFALLKINIFLFMH